MEHFYTIIVSAVLIALVSGSPNAFNFIENYIQDDLKLSNGSMSILMAIGQVGLYFTLPAGVVMDLIGYWKTALIGAVMGLVGYILMAVCNSDFFWLMCIGFGFVSFGAGAAFISALGVGVAVGSTRGSLPVACVSGGLSLSLAFMQLMITLYQNVAECKTDSCWRSYMIFYAVLVGVVMFPCAVCLRLYSPPEPENSLTEVTTEDPTTPSARSPSDRQTLLPDHTEKGKTSVLKHVLTVRFWILFLVYFSGISSGIFVVTQVKSLWEDVSGHTHSGWGNYLGYVFSAVTTVSNVVAGVYADRWQNRHNIPKTVLLGGALFVGFLTYTLISLFSALSLSTDFFIVLAALSLVLAGISFGITLTLLPAIVGSFYGPEVFGRVFSFIQFASAGAAVLIPIVGSAINDSVGHYYPLSVIIALCLFVSSVVILRMKYAFA